MVATKTWRSLADTKLCVSPPPQICLDSGRTVFFIPGVMPVDVAFDYIVTMAHIWSHGCTVRHALGIMKILIVA